MSVVAVESDRAAAERRALKIQERMDAVVSGIAEVRAVGLSDEEIAARLGLSRMASGPDHLYFLEVPGRSGAGVIKIGRARDVRSRRDQLQCGNPEHIRIHGVIPGRGYEEHAWHARFAHLRLEGEWFRANDELLDAIASEALR